MQFAPYNRSIFLRISLGIVALLHGMPLAVGATEVPPLGGATDPQLLQDRIEAVSSLTTQISIAQIPALILSGQTEQVPQQIAQVQNEINAMARKNPASLWAYLYQCELNKFIGSADALNYCEYTITLVDGRLERLPGEGVYYELKALAYLYLDRRADAEAVLLRGRSKIDPSDKVGISRIDSELQRLKARP